LILKENRIFGARFDWSYNRENRRLKKKLTKKVVQGIYDGCIENGRTFDKFDYTEIPDPFIGIMGDVNELFSLSTREKRIQKLQRFDELWGEKKLIYYQEI
jgi:hypothetical protein